MFFMFYKNNHNLLLYIFYLEIFYVNQEFVSFNVFIVCYTIFITLYCLSILKLTDIQILNLKTNTILTEKKMHNVYTIIITLNTNKKQ